MTNIAKASVDNNSKTGSTTNVGNKKRFRSHFPSIQNQVSTTIKMYQNNTTPNATGRRSKSKNPYMDHFNAKTTKNRRGMSNFSLDSPHNIENLHLK